VNLARARLFRLLETADNFVKYARAGGEQRAVERARKRYQRAAELARRTGDEEMFAQARIRLEDLDRRALQTASDTALAEPDDDETAAVVSTLPEHAEGRVPPGQRVTRGWPVLHEGRIPRFDPTTWSLRVDGACENEVQLSYDELKSLPNTEMVSDFHCVTGWSKLDNRWIGVQSKVLLELALPAPDASHVLVHADHGYTANVPLDVLEHEDALLAWGHNGADVVPKHGWPLRLIVPKLYAWKSVKWVRRFELLTEDHRGFWEVRGYHNRADPWLEERYSYQEN
jgi:DMSO/TMAO reductase YedYZ molybdopterin-dependent catalytic subunit